MRKKKETTVTLSGEEVFEILNLAIRKKLPAFTKKGDSVTIDVVAERNPFKIKKEPEIFRGITGIVSYSITNYSNTKTEDIEFDMNCTHYKKGKQWQKETSSSR